MANNRAINADCNVAVRTISALALQFLTFQFNLFANNATKFGAPGNRTPLKYELKN